MVPRSVVSAEQVSLCSEAFSREKLVVGGCGLKRWEWQDKDISDSEFIPDVADVDT